MTKRDLLDYLAHSGDVEAQDVANAFDLPYSTAAMALLRLVRQGLLARDPGEGRYFYRLTDRGRARLAYFRRYA